MKKLLFSLSYIIIILFLLSFWGFYSSIRPTKIVSTITPKDLGIAYENVMFKTQDGITLRGWFIPSQKTYAKTIILLHGYPADKGNILPGMIFLQKKYNLFLFDFRYLGASNGYYSTIGKEEVKDLAAAIAYLRKRNINEVGVWGFSMGGSVAIMAAPNTPAIKAIVAESPYARMDWLAYDHYRIPLLNYPLGSLIRFWGWFFLGVDIKDVSPALAANKITQPILLLHSKGDEVIHYDHALLLQHELRHHPKAQYIMTPSLQHGEFIENHEKIILDFFDSNLTN